MYKNTLQINLLDAFDIHVAESTISWSRKADVVNCVNGYIKEKKLIEIIKEKDDYSITWNSQESYDQFVTEDLYLSMVSELQELGVSISWKE
jgi:hypothetical protein